MKVLEIISQYFLVFWYFLCCYDGWAFLFFGIHPFGEPGGVFLPALMETTYFLVFLKIVQTTVLISLAFNYKPVVGLLLSLPSSAVLCLFYFFELFDFIPMAILIIISTAILFRKYLNSMVSLLDSYQRNGENRISSRDKNASELN